MLNSFYDKYIFTNTLNYKNNNFSLVNIPFIILPTDILISLLSSEDMEVHKKIYESVKKSTKIRLVERFKKMGIDKNKEISFIKNFFIASGWGKIEVVDSDEKSKRAIIVVDSSPFAKELKGKAKFPVDSIMRGVFAGLFSSFFGEKIDCVESECLALDAKSCKFVLKPTTEFDLQKKIVREQLVLE